MRTTIFFVLGPTNVGKTTLLEQAGVDKTVGLVEVGKKMRAKYLDPASPHYEPDYFKGNSSPTHTAAEAWKMMVDGIEDAIDAGKTTIFVDGQPRDVQQCDDVYTNYENLADKYNVRYVNLFARIESRRQRADLRDGTDPVKKDLSTKRMEGDCLKLYEVLSRILARGGRIDSFITDHPDFNTATAARQLVAIGDRTRATYVGDYTRKA